MYFDSGMETVWLLYCSCLFLSHLMLFTMAKKNITPSVFILDLLIIIIIDRISVCSNFVELLCRVVYLAYTLPSVLLFINDIYINYTAKLNKIALCQRPSSQASETHRNTRKPNEKDQLYRIHSD